MSPDRLMRAPRLFKNMLGYFYYWRGNMHRHFGNLSGERREYESAVNDFSRAIDLKPNFISAHFNRGVLYWRELENFYRAIRDMSRVMELAPYRSEAWFNRAIAYQLRGDSPQAIADLEYFLLIAGDDSWRASAESQLVAIKALAEERAEIRRQRDLQPP